MSCKTYHDTAVRGPHVSVGACAGLHYGRIVSGKPPFEELALLLVESGEPESLQVFLQTKLQVRRDTWARRPSCLMSQAAGIAFSSCVLLSTRPQQLS